MYDSSLIYKNLVNLQKHSYNHADKIGVRKLVEIDFITII